MAQAGAAVTVYYLPTGTRRTTVADASGRFVLTGLMASGPYIVQVQQPGFRPQNITNGYLTADEPTDLAVSLNPATVEVGTRRDDRTTLESAVPVDVVDVATLLPQVPHTDLMQLLQYTVPAFNSTR